MIDLVALNGLRSMLMRLEFKFLPAWQGRDWHARLIERSCCAELRRLWRAVSTLLSAPMSSRLPRKVLSLTVALQVALALHHHMIILACNGVAVPGLPVCRVAISESLAIVGFRAREGGLVICRLICSADALCCIRLR